MTVTVDRDELKRALDLTSPAVARRATLPVISGFLVAAHGEQATISATNLDLAISADIPAKVIEPMSVVLPATQLRELVAELPAGGVQLRTTLAHKVTMQSGHGVFELAGMDASEWPRQPELVTPAGDTLIARDLFGLVTRTLFAASTEDSRPILNSVLIERRRDFLRLVATNGHLLARAALPLTGAAPSVEQLIVPATSLRALNRLFAVTDELQLGYAPGHLALSTPSVRFITRLIEGPYPNHARVIPTANDKHAVVDRERLASMLRRMAAVSSPSSHGIICQLEDGSIAIEAAGDLFGGHEALDLRYAGPPFEFGVSAGYLLQVLEHMPTDEVRLSMRLPSTAMVVEPVEWNAPGDYLALVMPQRLVGDRSLSLESDDGHPLGGTA